MVRDADRTAAWGAITAAGEKAAESAEGVAKGDVGRHDIRGLPDRQVVLPHVPEADGHSGYQAAVEHEPALPDREGGKWILGEFRKIGQYIEEPGADDGREKQVHAHIENAVRVHPLLPAAPRRKVHGEEKTDADHEAVHPDGDGTEGPVAELNFGYFK